MKVTKKDLIWNYLGTFMTLASNFILLPFIMIKMNEDLVGLWYVFLSVGGIVTLLDFGFNPTLARNIAYAWSGASELSKESLNKNENNNVPNYYLMKKVISTCKYIYLIISLSALILLLSLGTVYIFFISSEIDIQLYLIPWIIYCAAVFIHLYFGYYTTFCRGIGAIAKLNIANVVSRLAQITISIGLLFLNFQLFAVSIAYLMNGLIFQVLAKYMFYHHENLRENLKTVDITITKTDIISTFKLIWHNAWRDGLVSISTYLSTQAATIICSLFFTLTETGIYSISLQLVTAISTVAMVVYSTYQPSLQAAFVNDDKEKSKKLISISLLFYCIVFVVGIIGVIFVGIPLLKFIKPTYVFSISILLLMCLYEFLFKFHSCNASFISNMNIVPYVWGYIISSCIGIALAFGILKFYNIGIYGLVLSQLAVQLVYNNWRWPLYVFRYLKMNLFDVVKIGTKEIIDKLKVRFNR